MLSSTTTIADLISDYADSGPLHEAIGHLTLLKNEEIIFQIVTTFVQIKLFPNFYSETSQIYHTFYMNRPPLKTKLQKQCDLLLYVLNSQD